MNLDSYMDDIASFDQGDPTSPWQHQQRNLCALFKQVDDSHGEGYGVVSHLNVQRKDAVKGYVDDLLTFIYGVPPVWVAGGVA